MTEDSNKRLDNGLDGDAHTTERPTKRARLSVEPEASKVGVSESKAPGASSDDLEEEEEEVNLPLQEPRASDLYLDTVKAYLLMRSIGEYLYLLKD